MGDSDSPNLHHRNLQNRLASLLGKDAAHLYATYAACNLIAISGAVRAGIKLALLDREAPASVYERCRLAGATIWQFEHNCLIDFEEKLANARSSGYEALVPVRNCENVKIEELEAIMAMTVNELCAEVTLFCNLDTSAHNYSANELFHHVLSAVHRLYLRIAECEHVNVSRDEILEAIRPVRDILSRSTFLKRLQTWPRGYSGDFETIEYLCSGSADPLPGTIHDVCEHYALVCSAAQQHRNKVKQQAALIVDTVMASSAMRILSIACGGAPDLALAVPAVKDRQFQCVLNDMDGEALAFAQQRNSAIQQKLSVHQGDVIRLLRRTSDLGRFDLVLAGGLFDYLSDRQIVFILRTIYQAVLAPGGSLFFTNISNMNPYRIWMTYFVNWQLIERSPDDIRRLVADAGIPADCVSVERDQTGLALLSTVKKSL